MGSQGRVKGKGKGKGQDLREGHGWYIYVGRVRGPFVEQLLSQSGHGELCVPPSHVSVHMSPGWCDRVLRGGFVQKTGKRLRQMLRRAGIGWHLTSPTSLAQTTVADNQTRQIWKAPKTEFCSARKVWEIISDCRFVTFEQRGVERYEPISLIRDFLKKMPKNLADPQNLRINS